MFCDMTVVWIYIVSGCSNCFTFFTLSTLIWCTEVFFNIFNVFRFWFNRGFYDFVFGRDLDHCRRCGNYHCRFFMRNEATICRINSIGCGYCSCSWCTSCCYTSFTFDSCGVFFITNTWLKWCNHNC